jgi:pantothenate kinase type III
VLFVNLFEMNGMAPSQVHHIIISSVVPPVESTLRQVCENYFHVQPLFVEPGIKTGMPVLVDNPTELGADRLVNAIAAFERYGGPCIVVDFGTATTFDVISAKGEYLGGAIAPGLGISADALFSRAARLSRVDIKRPAKVIGTNTVTHLQTGLYYGYIGLVDGILERIVAELGRKAAGDRHRRPGAANLRGLALHRRDRRHAHPRRPADPLRAQPHPDSEMSFLSGFSANFLRVHAGESLQVGFEVWPNAESTNDWKKATILVSPPFEFPPAKN